MALIRRVNVPQGQTVQILPPDDADHSGVFDWLIWNPPGSAGQVELVDDPARSIGDGMPLAPDDLWQMRARDESVYAAGQASGGAVELIVAGVRAGD